uniref:Uncharacterized protein n=1 Tax=Anguilla anguilla TaxID=7936 RepID=A0A0E9XUU3_ANGAN
MCHKHGSPGPGLMNIELGMLLYPKNILAAFQ